MNEIKILKSRSTKRRNCLVNEEDYDKKVLIEHIARKGCRDPYLEKHQSLPLCNTMEKIITNRFDYYSPDTLGIPYACRYLQYLDFSHYLSKRASNHNTITGGRYTYTNWKYRWLPWIVFG